ncbi:MAG: lipocalin family protein [Polyangiaceae bacterium]
MKPELAPRLRAIAAIILGCCLVSCANDSLPVPPAEYSLEIIGNWQGTVGDTKETVRINSEGTFVGQIHRTGFLANTLSQTLPGRVSGTWNVAGAMITLKITDNEHEHLLNRIATSTIKSFTADKLILKSERGETATFRRVAAF